MIHFCHQVIEDVDLEEGNKYFVTELEYTMQMCNIGYCLQSCRSTPPLTFESSSCHS